jgi:hypothetical protein
MRQEIDKAEIRKEFNDSPADSLFNTKALAIIVCRSVQWCHQIACAGGGIPFRKMGNSRLYQKSDIENWISNNSQFVKSTSEYINRKKDDYVASG